jgi:hypothetical protein
MRGSKARAPAAGAWEVELPRLGGLRLGAGRGECGELSGNDAASEGEQETEDEPKHGGTEDAGVSLVGMSKAEEDGRNEQPGLDQAESGREKQEDEESGDAKTGVLEKQTQDGGVKPPPQGETERAEACVTKTEEDTWHRAATPATTGKPKNRPEGRPLQKEVRGLRTAASSRG